MLWASVVYKLPSKSLKYIRIHLFDEKNIFVIQKHLKTKNNLAGDGACLGLSRVHGLHQAVHNVRSLRCHAPRNPPNPLGGFSPN